MTWVFPGTSNMPELIAFRTCKHERCSRVACLTRYYVLNADDVKEFSSRYWACSGAGYGKLPRTIAKEVYARWDFLPGEKKFKDQIEIIVRNVQDRIAERNRNRRSKFFRRPQS